MLILKFPFSHIFLVKQTETNLLVNTLVFELELCQDQDFVLIYDGPASVVFASQP